MLIKRLGLQLSFCTPQDCSCHPCLNRLLECTIVLCFALAPQQTMKNTTESWSLEQGRPVWQPPTLYDGTASTTFSFSRVGAYQGRSDWILGTLGVDEVFRKVREICLQFWLPRWGNGCVCRLNSTADPRDHFENTVKSSWTAEWRFSNTNCTWP